MTALSQSHYFQQRKSVPLADRQKATVDAAIVLNAVGVQNSGPAKIPDKGEKNARPIHHHLLPVDIRNSGPLHNGCELYP